MNSIELQIISFLIAITIHEAAHGYAAYLCGDTTAKNEGRLSLNPIDHIDPFGTVLLPAMLMLSGAPVFGWAKPVPIDPRNFKDPKTDEFWISLAGPASNLALALICSGVFNFILNAYATLTSESGYFNLVLYIVSFLRNLIAVNLVLFIFNLIPVPPLDGFHVVRTMLPDELYENTESPGFIGIIMFIILLSTGILDKIMITFYLPLLAYLT